MFDIKASDRNIIIDLTGMFQRIDRLQNWRFHVELHILYTIVIKLTRGIGHRLKKTSTNARQFHDIVSLYIRHTYTIHMREYIFPTHCNQLLQTITKLHITINCPKANIVLTKRKHMNCTDTRAHNITTKEEKNNWSTLNYT